MQSFKVDILAFGAHPDDVEYAASGVILKHIRLGKTVAIVDLTAGEMGTRDNQPNSILGLIDQIKHMNGIYGRPINAAFAEGFTAGRYIGINSFWQLI